MRVFIFCVGCWFITSCSQQSPITPVFKLTGQTMGTTYHITYIDSNKHDYGHVIDSLLVAVNKSMSTYEDNSIISRFNHYQGTDWFEVDRYFYEVFSISKILHQQTGGTFNPTVMPLVNFWGFGTEQIDRPDETLIDSLLELVNFNYLQYKRGDIDHTHHTYYIKRSKPNITLDFSAIAKGYGVDVIAEYLDEQKLNDYMIEIGGEVRAKGKNEKGELWKIGIDKPVEHSEGKIQSVVELDNMAMATSGNYRNFYVKNGRKYVHIINPRTGYPEVNTTLSVSVFAKECAVADAFATAFMVMGKGAGGLRIAKQQPGIEAYFIYGDNGNFRTVMTEGLEGKIKELTN